MKLLLDHYGLLHLAEREISTSKKQILTDLFKTEALSIWVTADSVAMIIRSFKTGYDKKVVQNYIKKLTERCTVVPVRQEIIMDALEEEGDLDVNINIGIARLFHLDCIYTQHPEKYEYADIPAVNLDGFYNHIDTYRTSPIKTVPFMDLKAQHGQIYTEIDARITRIIANTAFILGTQVKEFEQRFADLQKVEYCLGVSSGTAALHIALMALQIGPNDRVLLPVNTFIATAEAVSLVGATPVFVDCDEYYHMDVEQLRETIEMSILKDNRPPRALIIVHLYGQPADMSHIMALAAEFGIEVIEDACQAHMARYNGMTVGQFGRFGAFSFYPGKNLGAYGEAGALVTQDKELFQKAKMLRQHGEIQRYEHSVIGHNYRMTAIQGAVLAVKSQYLPQWTEKRQTIARRYSELLAEVEELLLPMERAGSKGVYHLYVIQTDQRDELRQYLLENGIDTGIHYPRMLHQHAAYSDLNYHENDFPVAETAARKILSLPMYPELSDQQILYVCDKIKTFFNPRNKH